MNNSGVWSSLAQWEKDRCILIAAESYVEIEHIAPSFLELAASIGSNSTSVVSGSLHRLERAGFVKLPPHNKTRSLVVLRPSTSMRAPAFPRKRTPAELLAEAALVLSRLRAWDMLDATTDGPFWRDQIDPWLADYERWKK